MSVAMLGQTAPALNIVSMHQQLTPEVRRAIEEVDHVFEAPGGDSADSAVMSAMGAELKRVMLAERERTAATAPPLPPLSHESRHEHDTESEVTSPTEDTPHRDNGRSAGVPHHRAAQHDDTKSPGSVGRGDGHIGGPSETRSAGHVARNLIVDLASSTTDTTDAAPANARAEAGGRVDGDVKTAASLAESLLVAGGGASDCRSASRDAVCMMARVAALERELCGANARIASLKSALVASDATCEHLEGCMFEAERRVREAETTSTAVVTVATLKEREAVRSKAIADMMQTENSFLHKSNDTLNTRVSDIVQVGAYLRGTINTLTEDLNKTRLAAQRDRSELASKVDMLERKARGQMSTQPAAVQTLDEERDASVMLNSPYVAALRAPCL
jgi:hypothetical protein